MRTLPCLIRDRWCSGEIDAHHVRSRGAGGIDEANVVPLCHGHHMEGHTGGWHTFQQKHDIDLTDRAERIWKAYSVMVSAVRNGTEI